MFDLDPGKLLVIGVVALIAIPSKDLPRVLRTLGQVTGRMRRMAAEFQDQFMEAMREAELADLEKEIEKTNKAIMAGTKLDAAFDPMAEARKQIASAIEDADKKASEGSTARPIAEAASFETQPSAAPREEGCGTAASSETPEK